MSTAAETPDAFRDVLAPRKGIYIAERGTHVPAHYTPHAENVLVMQDGVPLLPQFRVRDVAPERRWAIYENGEIMAQHEFQAVWHQHIIENLRLAEEYMGNPHARIDISPEREPVPNVIRYISVKVDPFNHKRLTLIHYDAHKKAPAGGGKDFFDQSGERTPDDRLETLVRSYHDPKARAKMRPGEIAEAEAALGLHSGAGLDSIRAKLDMLLALKESGDITPEVFDRKIAALTGVEAAPVAAEVPAVTESEPSDPPGSDSMKLKPGQCRAPCGAVIGSFQSKKHKASCDACKAVVAEE